MYITNDDFHLDVGFEVTTGHIQQATGKTSEIITSLPASLYKAIDYKTTSAMIGSIFCNELAKATGAIVNPIEKGHPDIIPSAARNETEESLRNYPHGIEIKCTVGNIVTGANLRAGSKRIDLITGITWQAHHREVKELLGLIWDFSYLKDDFLYPIITGAFYSAELITEDWGQISGTTGRNTKVTGMTRSGKTKMGTGWVLLKNSQDYINKYQSKLNFTI